MVLNSRCVEKEHQLALLADNREPLMEKLTVSTVTDYVERLTTLVVKPEAIGFWFLLATPGSTSRLSRNSTAPSLSSLDDAVDPVYN